MLRFDQKHKRAERDVPGCRQDRAGAGRAPAFGRKRGLRTTRRDQDPDARFSAKRSRARHDVALAAIALPAAWGSTRASTRRRSSGPARADECVRGRSSENSQVMGAITPNQPNLVAGVGRHHQQPPPGGHRLPHRGSGSQFSDNLAAKQSRDEPPGRRLFRRHCDRVVRSATWRKAIAGRRAVTKLERCGCFCPSMSGIGVAAKARKRSGCRSTTAAY